MTVGLWLLFAASRICWLIGERLLDFSTLTGYTFGDGV
jgi:hypothetical protein